MSRLVVIKRLGMKPSRLDSLRYRARRLSIVSGPRNSLESSWKTNLRPYFNGSAFRHTTPDFFHFRVRYTNASIGPIHQAMQSPEVSKSLWKAMYHHGSAWRHAFGARLRHIILIGIRDVYGKVGGAILISIVQLVTTLRSPFIAFHYFLSCWLASKRNRALFHLLIVQQQDQFPLPFQDKDGI